MPTPEPLPSPPARAQPPRLSRCTPPRRPSSSDTRPIRSASIRRSLRRSMSSTPATSCVRAAAKTPMALRSPRRKSCPAASATYPEPSPRSIPQPQPSSSRIWQPRTGHRPHYVDAQQMRRPVLMAQMLATRLKGGASGSGAGSSAPGPGAASAGPEVQGPAAASAQPASGAPQQHSGNGGGGSGGGPNAAGAGTGASPGGWSGQAAGAGDPQQMLSRAPAIQLSDLQKGEAVMIVSTEGASDVTAVTLLAGVEPLLQAPAASQNLLSNWSMGSGGGAEGAATP